MVLHSSSTRRLYNVKGIDQHQATMKFVRRRLPCEKERNRVRRVDAIAIKHRGDIDRKQVVLVDRVVDLNAELARNLEQAALELLVDLGFGVGFRRRKRLLGVFDAPA